MFSTVVVPGVFNFLSWIMDGIAVLPDYARNKIAFACGIHTGIYQTVSYFYCLSSFSRLFCSEMDVKMYEGRQLCGKIATHETLILRALWCSISPAKLNATISYSHMLPGLTLAMPSLRVAKQWRLCMLVHSRYGVQWARHESWAAFGHSGLTCLELTTRRE